MELTFSRIQGLPGQTETGMNIATALQYGVPAADTLPVVV